MGCVLKARVGGWLCLINSAKETVEVIVSTEEQTMMKLFYVHGGGKEIYLEKGKAEARGCTTHS
jgi:hypothetical protein